MISHITSKGYVNVSLDTYILGDIELLLRIETELLLYVLDILSCWLTCLLGTPETLVGKGNRRNSTYHQAENRARILYPGSLSRNLRLLLVHEVLCR